MFDHIQYIHVPVHVCKSFHLIHEKKSETNNLLVHRSQNADCGLIYVCTDYKLFLIATDFYLRAGGLTTV